VAGDVELVERDLLVRRHGYSTPDYHE